MSVGVNGLPTRFSDQKQALLKQRLSGRVPLSNASEDSLDSRNGHYPLSFAQRRLWFLNRLEGSSHYVLSKAWKLDGKLDLDLLERAFAEVIGRHEPLRMQYEEIDGEPVQRVRSEWTYRLPSHDLSGMDRNGVDERCREILQEDAEHDFDLGGDLMIRGIVVRVDREETWFQITMHHIAVDGWSFGLVIEELSAAYNALTASQPVRFEPLPMRYVDIAVREKAAMSSESVAAQMRFWRQQLKLDVAPLELPFDRPRHARQLHHGDVYSTDLSEESTQGLAAVCSRFGLTTYMALLAAYQILLRRFSGQDHIRVGSPVAGRNDSDTEGVVGFFSSTIVLSGVLGRDATIERILENTKALCLDAYSNQDVPFERLVEVLQPKRSLSHNPIFQVMLAVQNTPPASINLNGTTAVEVPSFQRTAKVDLTLFVNQAQKQLTLDWEYNSDLFDRATLARFASAFDRLIGFMIDRPTARLSEIPWLTFEERRQVLGVWNLTQTPYGRDRNLAELFEGRVGASPNSVALEQENEHLTYRQLNERSNRLARFLVDKGVRCGQPVGTLFGRSVDSIVAMLAVVKAGAYYVPLDPGFPPARIRMLVDDAGMKTVLTESDRLALLEVADVRAFCLETMDGELQEFDSSNPKLSVDGGFPAYLMYTSGSTGRPKGSLISHRSVVRLVRESNYATFTNEYCFLHFAPQSFDAATLEIWGAILNGARMTLFPAVQPSLRELGEFIVSNRISVLWLTAALFHRMVDHELQSLAGLRLLLAGGEALNIDSVNKYLSLPQHGILINGYGPTENTTFTCCHSMDEPQSDRKVSIGRPVANTQVYVLDQDLQPLSVGCPGELFVGGDGLALGYWDRPALTAESFIPNPFAVGEGGRLYRTGDRVRYESDGRLEFLGRVDHQIKIRGYRVELGEVEAELRSHPDVKEAAVKVFENTGGSKKLVGYVSPREGRSISYEILKKFVGQRLPAYMHPSEYVELEILPINANGKTDYRALKSPTPVSTNGDYVPPSDEIERELVAIWQRVLGQSPICVTDNFFELGGHSLLAVKLFSEIQRHHHRTLPLATLFEAPTIRGLSQVLKSRDWEPTWSCTVPIQTLGSKPPLFCVHGVGGNILNYYSLARHLAPDQPVYGIQARGLHSEHEPLVSVPAMARHYVDAIRERQPVGPYHICGMSFGGWVAFEMARLLRADGEEVGFVGLFDVGAHLRDGRTLLQRTSFLWGTLWQRVRMHVENLWQMTPSERQNYIAGKLKTLKRRKRSRQWQKQYRKLERGGGRLPSELREVKEACWLAAKEYGPEPYDGKVTVFRASIRSVGGNQSPDMGWSLLANGGVDVFPVQGDHLTIMDEPNVASLSKAIRAALANGTALAL